jgi:aryl-alcohol dehydrogenase-like predicted oxidoreductase
VGVSNYSLEQWSAAERALRAPVVANQVRFSLASPGPARDLVPHAARQGRLVVAHSPLGQGLLATRPGTGAGPTVRSRGLRAASPLVRDGARASLEPLVAAVADIAARHEATPAQVALAWVIGHPNAIAIPGARTIAQLEENAAAADLRLGDDEFARLSAEAAALVGRVGA